MINVNIKTIVHYFLISILLACSLHASNNQEWESNLNNDKTIAPPLESWWTGKTPVYGQCPGVNEEGAIQSLPLPNLSTCTRKQAQEYFDNTWTLTEVLFSALQGEKPFYRAPYHGLRHPLIFYYGHPAVLYINKLRVAGILEDPLNPEFEELFATGVDEMSWDDLSKNEKAWPSVQEIRDYRQQVYKIVSKVIAEHPDFDELPITQKSQAWAIFMGFEHERIHVETSSVLIRELPLGLVKRPAQWPKNHPSALIEDCSTPKNSFIKISEGSVTLGKDTEFPSYGWDNEYGKKTIDVQKFETSKFLISNGEFLEFVRDGGYFKPEYWSKDGWSWKSFRNLKYPTFWVPKGPVGLHEYKLRLCFEEISMQKSWPAEVNYYEAKAYANWLAAKSNDGLAYRLLTEAEHWRLRDEKNVDPVMISGGDTMAKQFGYNLNLSYGSQSPVDAHKPNDKGFYDVFGNVWSWCEDHQSALPGFKIHPYYPDFTTPCFDGKHNMLMGGSFVSTGDEASEHARYQFRPHFFQHAGFRLVRTPVDQTFETSCMDSPGPNVNGKPCCETPVKDKKTNNPYETQQYLNDNMLLHYGTPEQVAGSRKELYPYTGFPKRCADYVIEWAKKYGVNASSAADIGCAVGGSTFELSKYFQNVIGIDFSENFIKVAQDLQKGKTISYLRKEEGEIYTTLTAKVDESINLDRVNFLVGDACNLPNIGKVDAFFMGNLLCRVPEPIKALEEASKHLNSGGILVMTTPFSWKNEFTVPEKWLGGYMDKEGNPVYSFEGLLKALEGNFKFLEKTDLPMIIRDHDKRFEIGFPEATVWKKL